MAQARAEVPERMRAMVFTAPGEPLQLQELALPEPGPGELLVHVHACAVCRTDLHLLDGEVTVAQPPRVLGHQVIGVVARGGPDVAAELLGARVGIPWLGWTCGECEFCTSGRENLCPRARFTGRDIDGGMAEYACADARYCFEIPPSYPDLQAAPLMCAGVIGHRALRMCGDAPRLGLYGFGASAHILAQVASWQGREVYAFTRPGDTRTQAFARELGAAWAGGSDEPPPRRLHAAILLAPDGSIVPAALAALEPGGRAVCGGIHMSDLPSMPYALLWQERMLRSVANLTREDARELLELAPRVPVRTTVTRYALEDANTALGDLRHGRLQGAAVLVIDGLGGEAPV
jgi:propanol-preferring alcohol dehydrogenase